MRLRSHCWIASSGIPYSDEYAMRDQYWHSDQLQRHLSHLPTQLLDRDAPFVDCTQWKQKIDG